MKKKIWTYLLMNNYNFKNYMVDLMQEFKLISILILSSIKIEWENAMTTIFATTYSCGKSWVVK